MFQLVEVATINFETALRELQEVAMHMQVEYSIGKTAEKGTGHSFARSLVPDERGWSRGFGFPVINEGGDYSADKWLWLDVSGKLTFGGKKTRLAQERFERERVDPVQSLPRVRE